MTNNVCQDKYKAWDFYLLAPGTTIYSTVPTAVNKLGYSTMTGTSMAAPTISGGVALIRQMWPQMTGSNIVKLLLVTANKNLPGYNVYTMGQGMMDLDRATRPVGTLGVPTTGRLSGMKLAGAQPLLVTGSGSASTGRLGNVMIVDDFERDFYIKGRTFTGVQSLTQTTPGQFAMPYTTLNNYSQFNSYTNHYKSKLDNLEITLYRNVQDTNSPNMFEVSYTKQSELGDLKFTAGAFNEQSTWLGNSVNGFNSLGTNRGSNTQFTGIGFNKLFDDKSSVYANVSHGITRAKSHSDNIKNLSTVNSYTWTVGAEKALNNNNKIGVMSYQPVSVYRAWADITAPVGLDDQFNIVQHSRVNLAADAKELRTGFYHKFNNKTINSIAFIETRLNYKGQVGVRDTAVGIMFNQQY